jgi:hypothetical protein
MIDPLRKRSREKWERRRKDERVKRGGREKGKSIRERTAHKATMRGKEESI